MQKKINKISTNAERPITMSYLKSIRIIYKNMADSQTDNKQKINEMNDIFRIKDKLSTYAIDLCEHFNEFFINVGPTLRIFLRKFPMYPIP